MTRKSSGDSTDGELQNLRRRVAELESDLFARDTEPSGTFRSYHNVSSSLLKSIFESTEDLIAAMDPSFRYLAFNHAYQEGFTKVFGVQIDVGTNLLLALAHLPEEAAKAEALWRRALEGEEFTFVQEFGDTRLERRMYEFRFNTLRSEDGQVIGAIHLVRDRTAQKRIEMELAAARDQGRTILESITDAFFALDTEWRFTYVNSETERILGLPRRDLLGRSIWDVYPDLAETTFGIQYHRARKEGIAVHFEEYYPPLDIWFLVHAYPSEEGLAVYFQNTNERKVSENRLIESEKRFSAAFAAAPVGMVLATPDGKIIEANDAYLGMLGYSLPELYGSDSTTFTPPEQVLATRQFFEQFQEGAQTPSVIEKAYIHKNGSVVWARIWATMRRDVKGVPLQVVAIIQDISKEKSAQESSRRFSFLMEQSSDFIGIASLDGRMIFLNEAGQKLVGLADPEQLNAISITDFFPPGEQEVIRKLQAKGDQQGQWSGESAFRHFVSKAEIPVMCSISMIRDENGHAVALATISRDVTEQRRAAQELRTRNDELLRANRELEEFTYVASHDLQEPLRMVNIYTHLLLREFGEGVGQRAKEFAGNVENGVKRMQALISDLLDYSRAVHKEEDQADRAVPVALGALLAEVLKILAESIRETKALITFDPLPEVLGDETQMTQVLQNLLSNALKYQKPGVVPEIHVSSTSAGGYVTVIVKDNGIGFDPQYKERIFGLFKRLHKTEYPGTGLGLAISKRIVERYGGRMWAESTEGEGSTFYFRLRTAMSLA